MDEEQGTVWGSWEGGIHIMDIFPLGRTDLGECTKAVESAFFYLDLVLEPQEKGVPWVILT